MLTAISRNGDAISIANNGLSKLLISYETSETFTSYLARDNPLISSPVLIAHNNTNRGTPNKHLCPITVITKFQLGVARSPKQLFLLSAIVQFSTVHIRSTPLLQKQFDLSRGGDAMLTPFRGSRRNGNEAVSIETE